MQANNQMEDLPMKANKCTMAGLLALFLTIASQGTAFAQKKAAEFDPALWDLERAKIVDHLGRKALVGSAFLKDVRLQSGVIEVDVATTEQVAFLSRVAVPGAGRRELRARLHPAAPLALL